MEIENNVPIPARGLGIAAVLRKMNIGQSIVLPRNKQSIIAQTAKNLGLKVVSRKISDAEIRVWVVKKVKA